MKSISKVKKSKKNKSFDYLRYRIEVEDINPKQSSKKITNMNFNQQPKVITATLNQKLTKIGSNNRNYLLLKLDNQETIFVFHSKDTPESIWDDLQENQTYTFTVREANRPNSNILVAFELEL